MGNTEKKMEMLSDEAIERIEYEKASNVRYADPVRGRSLQEPARPFTGEEAMMTTSPRTAQEHPKDPDDYETLRLRFQSHFQDVRNSRFFTTDAAHLFEHFLDALPAERRQHYNCHTCRHFFERYAGLVTIDVEGVTWPVFWCLHDVPSFFSTAVADVRREVARAKVTGVFFSNEREWGHVQTPDEKGHVWYHLAVVPNAPPSTGIFSPLQKMAEKREEYGMVSRALAEFSHATVDTALRILRSDKLYGSEHVLGQGVWLDKLYSATESVFGRTARENIVWYAVAHAPSGFCHPRTSMIGSLLEDIEAGLPFDTIAEKFKKKMDPLHYQRPQAAPAAGNIAQAEKLVAELGLARSFERRYARLEEIETLWTPKKEEAPKGGVFGHLKSKEETATSPLHLPQSVMTWEKFSRTVLPTADQIEFRVTGDPMGYVALLTAVHPDAPPIFQWDRPEKRNTISWYTHNNGSVPAMWNLVNGYVRVSAIALQPNLWVDPPLVHISKGVIFLLEGARPQHAASLGLFPVFMRSELHGVRAVIEAHSNSASPSGAKEATACGVTFWAGGRHLHSGYTFRVTTEKTTQLFMLDRWD